jgi:hypothetical protein
MLSALLLLGSLTAFSIGQPRRHLLPRNIISQRAAKAQRAISYTGEKRQLVVLASFSDLDFRQEEPIPLWDSIFNMPNFTEEPYYGSVHDFFTTRAMVSSTCISISMPSRLTTSTPPMAVRRPMMPMPHCSSLP